MVQGRIYTFDIDRSYIPTGLHDPCEENRDVRDLAWFEYGRYLSKISILLTLPHETDRS